MEKFTCPVRDYRTNNQGENDRWVLDKNGVITCSYCKSIKPSSLERLINDHGYQIVQHSNKTYKLLINVFGKQYHYYTIHNTENFNETLYRLVWSQWNKSTITI